MTPRTEPPFLQNPAAISLLPMTRRHSLYVLDGNLALQVVGQRVLVDVQGRQLKRHVILQLRGEALLNDVRAALQREVGSGRVRSGQVCSGQVGSDSDGV